ncbi:hypothetical protein ACFXGI_24520 [Streptomyces sp. NPDC059355]|uniref:hypothetical protein n=1 Tax=Streptomyces sp. NPDC059355 TaxID=3346811 RepID=UPI0036CB4088
MTIAEPSAPSAPDAELYIDRVEAADDGEVSVVVRCIEGPVRLGARFRSIPGSAAEIDLQVIRILFYRRSVTFLDPVCTAMVTLRGSGALHLHEAVFRTIRGVNPARP